MAKLASNEIFAARQAELIEEPSLRNRLVRLVEAYPGRIIHGIAVRIPEDSLLMELESGMPHAEIYCIQPPRKEEPGAIQEPSYCIYPANVVSIEAIYPFEIGPQSVVWPE